MRQRLDEQREAIIKNPKLLEIVFWTERALSEKDYFSTNNRAWIELEIPPTSWDFYIKIFMGYGLIIEDGKIWLIDYSGQKMKGCCFYSGDVEEVKTVNDRIQILLK